MLAVPVYLRKSLQALLQNMPNAHLCRQPLTFAMLSMPEGGWQESCRGLEGGWQEKADQGLP